MVKTTTLYAGGLHCTVTHEPSGRTLETDAPVDNQGRGESFSPTDLLGVALGSCMATTMGIKAREMALEGLRIEVSKEMSTDAPRRIAKLTTEIWAPIPRSADPQGLLEQAAFKLPGASESAPRNGEAGGVPLGGRGAMNPISLAAAGCLTGFGHAPATLAALLRGETALKFSPVLGQEGGDSVPLALCNDWQPADASAPRWAAPLFGLLADVPDRPWGEARFPIFIVSSNFGIDNLYAYRREPSQGRLPFILPQRLTDFFRRELGWGANISHYSHACVSSNLGLLYASRQVEAGLAEEALVVSYDFLSPFVAAGFHAMKILTGELPAPYADRPFGAIGLGDGAAFAVVAPATGKAGEFRLDAQAGANEMFHFTGNHPDGVGMGELGDAMRESAGGRKLWIKGHGTGTIEAGKLEAHHMARCFPGAPLVGWKGALGHTLGSCGLVELTLAMEAVRGGRAPGTVGSSGGCYSTEVATESFNLTEYDGVVLNSYAFGGAHYAFLLGWN